MLQLSQHESNVFYWSKNWYGWKGKDFWKELSVICKEEYLMECAVEDIYSIVRMLWVKILNVHPNKENLWDQYEADTLPDKARYYFGSPNYGNRDWHCDDSFTGKQILQARTAKMISQIGATATKHYQTMFPKDIGELKVVNKKELREMIKNRQNNED